MSNVLIGIIGVILFIGLALAGALFLGPRFQEATINSKAATEMAQVTQYANAVALFQLQEGEKYTNDKKARLVPAYLKVVPTSTSGTNYAGYDEDNQFAYMLLGGVDLDQSRRICESIQRTMTGSPVLPVVDALYNAGKHGCSRNSASTGYMVHQRI